MRDLLKASAFLAASLVAILLSGCPSPEGDGLDGGTVPAVTSAQVDDKSRLYNLIGRWYPLSEVKHFQNENLTPEEWCQREPMRLTVMPDSIEVHCVGGESYTAALARVRTTTAAETILFLRAGKDSPLRQIRFTRIEGPNATIAGVPCFGGRPEPHQRFPEFEILTRQILGGRRCSQLETTSPSGRRVPTGQE